MLVLRDAGCTVDGRAVVVVVAHGCLPGNSVGDPAGSMKLETSQFAAFSLRTN